MVGVRNCRLTLWVEGGGRLLGGLLDEQSGRREVIILACDVVLKHAVVAHWGRRSIRRLLFSSGLFLSQRFRLVARQCFLVVVAEDGEVIFELASDPLPRGYAPILLLQVVHLRCYICTGQDARTGVFRLLVHFCTLNHCRLF